jgi:hypothetical protein
MLLGVATPNQLLADRTWDHVIDGITIPNTTPRSRHRAAHCAHRVYSMVYLSSVVYSLHSRESVGTSGVVSRYLVLGLVLLR